jgi:hypothetical protein
VIAILRRLLALFLLRAAVKVLPIGLSKADLVDRVAGYAANEDFRIDIEMKATKARMR